MFLDLLAAPVGAAIRLTASTDGRASTADPSLGTVVLYRPGGRDAAEFARAVAKIDRVAPLTPADERRIDSNLRAADAVVVFGVDAEERLLADRDVCKPAGSVAGELLTLCVARSDEARFVRFVVDGRALPVAPIAETGWWSWAAAAPDGRTILARWTTYASARSAGDCSAPESALIPADGRRPVTLGPAVPLGWTEDGRAIVFRRAGPAARAAPIPASTSSRPTARRRRSNPANRP